MTNFKEEAEGATAKVVEIGTEIRELEDRKKKFEADAAAAREIATSALSAIGQAKLDEDESRANTFRKARDENEKRAEELKAAISATDDRIHIAKAKLADAKREAETAAQYAQWATMLDVIQSKKPQLADVLSAFAPYPSLLADLARSLTISAEHPLRKLDEISAGLRASLENSLAPQQTFVPPGPPLICDTVVFALAPFRYSNNGGAIICIPGGWIGLMPKAAAIRAVEKGVGQILTPPKKMVVIVGRRPIDFNTDNGLRTIAARSEVTLETNWALRLAREGKLEMLAGPSPTDMVTYQQLTVNRAKRAPEISLGTIRDETPSDDKPAAADLPSEPEPPEQEVSSKHAQRHARARNRATVIELASTLGAGGKLRHGTL